MLHQNALYGNAGLAGVAEASRDAALGRVGQVSVVVHDYSRVASQLKHHFLFSGAALDVPTNRHTARETDELDAIVGDQKSGVFVGEWQNIQTAVRPPRMLHAFG